MSVITNKLVGFRAFLDDMRRTSEDPRRKAFFAWRNSLHGARQNEGLALLWSTPTLTLPDVDAVVLSAITARYVPVSAEKELLNILEFPMSFQSDCREYRLFHETRRPINLTGRLPRERPFIFDLLYTKNMRAKFSGRYWATSTVTHTDIYFLTPGSKPRLAYRMTPDQAALIEFANFDKPLAAGDQLIKFSKKARVGVVAVSADGNPLYRSLPAYVGDLLNPDLPLSQAAASRFAVNDPAMAKPTSEVLPYLCGTVSLDGMRRTTGPDQLSLLLCCSEIADGTPLAMLSRAAVEAVLTLIRAGELVFNSPVSGQVESFDADYSDQYALLVISGQHIYVPAQCLPEVPPVGSTVVVGQPLFSWSEFRGYAGDDDSLLFALAENFCLAHFQTLVFWHKKICLSNGLAWHLQPRLIVPLSLLGNTRPDNLVLDFSRTRPYLEHVVGDRHLTCDLLDYATTDQAQLWLRLVGL